MKIRLRITVYKELEINHGKNADFLGLYKEIRKISIGGNNLPVKLLTYTSLLYVQIRSASNSELEYFKLLIISSILLYSSELWSLSKAQNNKLDVFQRIFLRQIIRNRKISNNEIYKLCNIEPCLINWNQTSEAQMVWSSRTPTWKCAC